MIFLRVPEDGVHWDVHALQLPHEGREVGLGARLI